jgi:hypothetical protein
VARSGRRRHQRPGRFRGKRPDCLRDRQSHQRCDFGRTEPNADWTTTGRGFAQFFEVELREDMHARVTSGRDPTGRALSVPATTGVDGRRLMLVLDESSFAAGRASPSGTETSRLLPRFRFIASATVDLNERRSLHDDLGPGPPTGTVRFEYPPR